MAEAKIVNLSVVNQKRRQEAFEWAYSTFMSAEKLSKDSFRISLDLDKATYVRYHCVPSLFCDRKSGKTLFRRDWLDDETFSCVAVSNLAELCSSYDGDTIKELLENGVKIHQYFKNKFAPRNPAQFFS